MMKKGIFASAAVVLLIGIFLTSMSVRAQAPAAPAPAAAAPAAAAADAGGGDAPPAAASQKQTFFDIVLNSGVSGVVDWILLFACSAGTLALIIDGCMTLKREKIMPPELIDSVKSALDQGDLGTALESCTSRPCPLANILGAGFNNISEGFDVIQDSVSAAADMESEKLMQRVNYLNLLGALGPMLGLLGTVTGMVDAFAGLATLSGAAKQSVLALSISQALYTTVVGLLISIPAIVGYTLLRNTTTKNLLAMETVTFDMIKVLRGAEVVEDEQG